MIDRKIMMGSPISYNLNANNRFNVTYVFADRPGEYNTSNWRCVIPGKALGRAGYGVFLVPFQLFQQNTKEAQQAIENSHIVVVERNFIGDVLTQIAYWIVRGKVVIANFDDAYHAIEKDNVSYSYWHDGTTTIEDDSGNKQTLYIFPHPYWQFQTGLSLVHAQTMPSRILADYYEKYSPTYLVPNYFETGVYTGIEKTKRKHIVIGWGGSMSHVQSFKESGILGAFKNVVEKKNNVKILIVGDKRVYDELLDVPEDRKMFRGYVPYEEWAKLLAQEFDIGVAPLCGEYDRYRSYIKIVEYMLTKTPFVATLNDAYSPYEKYGTFVNNDEESWTNALLEKIDNFEKESILAAGEPYQFALSQDVDLNVENIAETYRQIALEHANVNLYGKITIDNS